MDGGASLYQLHIVVVVYHIVQDLVGRLGGVGQLGGGLQAVGVSCSFAE